MNLRHYVTGLAIVLAMAFNLLDASSCDSNGLLTKYLQGGAPDGGDGSKDKPYNSFTQAEAGTWQKLVVLPSTTTIYGGITLNDGQIIEGKDRSRCTFASVDDSIYNGDVIVTNGNNCISGITISTSFRCGIQALMSKNLTVANCTFTNCNTNPNEATATFSYDYFFTSTGTNITPWSAICFFGGPTTFAVVQPCNTENGKFTLCNCTFDNNAQDLFLATGDSISTTDVPQTYIREYSIKKCTFTNTRGVQDIGGDSISCYVSGGGYLYGTIQKCSIQNIATGSAIKYSTIFANNPNFPGRGNYNFGNNVVEDSFIAYTSRWGVIFQPNGNLTNDWAQMIVKDTQFVDIGSIGNSPPAVIEFSYAAIQAESTQPGTGNSYSWIVENNKISDSTGLAPSITFYFSGGNQSVNAQIEKNRVTGTTTGVDILYYNNGGEEQANGAFYIAHNKFIDNDSVLVVVTAQNSPYTNLTVQVEDNCFINTGARNSPPYQLPPYNNGSYYGGAVIFGGADNTACQQILQNGTDLGNAIVDLGGGPLSSRGHNSFINTTGADTWVEPTLTLYAEENWFGGNPPVDAGVGGTVLFNPVLTQLPFLCTAS